MRVLLLTQVLPYPPDSGPKVKTYSLLKYLTERHEVTLVSFTRESDKPEYVQRLEMMCERVITVPIQRSKVEDLRFLRYSLRNSKPWMMVRDDRPEMRQVLADLASEAEFDVVHADQTNMGQYALPFTNSRKVLDLHNALWMLYKRMAETTSITSPFKYLLQRDWPLLKKYEGELCRQFDIVTAVTQEDRQLLLEAGAPDNIIVIPIAIDTQEHALIDRRPSGPHIVHVGTMYWPPNINGINWFLEEIYPRIKKQVPDVRCTLVGSRPPESIIQRTRTDRTLTVTGYVDDPLPYMEDASLMVVPLKAGGGMRVKILNALSQGIPMVSTTVGCEGIKVRHEHDILIADKPAEFAAGCVRLLTDYDLNERLTRAGRLTAEQHYDYRQVFQPLDPIYAPLEV